MGRAATDRLPRQRGGITAVGLLLIIYMGSSAPAWALQILEASDHAELAAEISDTDVNRIALDSDRVSRVIQSPGGFTVEHDAVRGDLYLYPDRATLRSADGLRAAVAFACADTRDALPGNGTRIHVPPEPVGGVPGLGANPHSKRGGRGRAGSDRQNETGRPLSIAAKLVALILAVARREPVAGYVIVPAPESMTSPERGSVVELWRGPRFTARVLRTPAGGVEDAERLAELSGASAVAAWMSAPGRGPNGERIAVLVEDNVPVEPVR